jgi:phosphoglycerate dehydrogenase-like enzyme
MKFVFYTKLSSGWLEQIDLLRKEFAHIEFVTNAESMEGEIPHAHALVAGEITPELLGPAARLHIIFVPYAGVDALPLEMIRERGIRISNVHVNAPFVAERCIAMALAFYGKIVDYHNDLKKFQWHGYWAKGTVDDTWNSIQGRPCAVIGAGEIGKHIAKQLKAFGCPIIGFRKRAATPLPEYFDHITLDLNEALERSELVFVALPLTPETKGMISAQILSRMRGKFLVNVGRGEIVDEEGLYRSLKDGILKGAAIDAWYTYPEKDETTAVPSRYPIYELPNVILSPHLAGFTPEAAALNITHTIQNIRSYIQTGRAVHEVDLRMMY